MQKSLKSNKVISIFILIFLIIFISSPKIYMQTTLNALSVWFYNVLPALLPFFIGTRLLVFLSVNKIKPLDKFTKKAFKTDNAGKIFFLSLISGYPVGAKLISSAYNNGQIDLKSAKKMMAFCSVSGPMFIIGSIGIGVFKSTKIGYVLLACHILGAIINGIFFRLSYKNQENSSLDYISTKPSNNILADSMLDSITSILLVGGYIVFSFILIEMLNNLQIIPSISYYISKFIPYFDNNTIISILNGLLEMTSGLISLGKLNLSYTLNICISSFLISFGGISVFLQSLNFTKELGINKSYYLFQKFCQGIFSLLIAIIYCLVF